MKTSRRISWIIGVAAIVATAVGFPGRLPGQTSAAKSSGATSGSPMQSSVQVDRVDPGDSDLAYSFQVAIYENLIEELNTRLSNSNASSARATVTQATYRTC